MSIIINLKIFIFIAIFLITRQIKIYALLMLFGFIHEMGHLVTGIFLGLKVDNIKIAPYGFSITFEKQEQTKKLCFKKSIIALAGPLTNLLIIGIIYLYSNIKNINGGNLENVIYANILLFIFNMLPIYPLDGGRIIKEIIRIYIGEKESDLYIQKISYATIILLTMLTSVVILIYKNIALLIVIVYLWVIVIKENKYQKMLTNIVEKNID